MGIGRGLARAYGASGTVDTVEPPQTGFFICMIEDGVVDRFTESMAPTYAGPKRGVVAITMDGALEPTKVKTAFGRKRVLLSNHMKADFKYPADTSENNAKAKALGKMVWVRNAFTRVIYANADPYLFPLARTIGTKVQQSLGPLSYIEFHSGDMDVLVLSGVYDQPGVEIYICMYVGHTRPIYRTREKALGILASGAVQNARRFLMLNDEWATQVVTQSTGLVAACHELDDFMKDPTTTVRAYKQGVIDGLGPERAQLLFALVAVEKSYLHLASDERVNLEACVKAVFEAVNSEVPMIDTNESKVYQAYETPQPLGNRFYPLPSDLAAEGSNIDMTKLRNWYMSMRKRFSTLGSARGEFTLSSWVGFAVSSMEVIVPFPEEDITNFARSGGSLAAASTPVKPLTPTITDHVTHARMTHFTPVNSQQWIPKSAWAKLMTRESETLMRLIPTSEREDLDRFTLRGTTMFLTLMAGDYERFGTLMADLAVTVADAPAEV